MVYGHKMRMHVLLRIIHVFCKGDLAPLPVETLEPYLSISPGAKLLQGEWEKHGSCAFDSAEAYFKQEKALFESLSLPNEQLSRKRIISMDEAE